MSECDSIPYVDHQQLLDDAEARIAEFEVELQEQSRLLGMSAEREKDLIAKCRELELDCHTKDAFYGEKIAELGAENERLREALKELLSRVANDADAHAWWCDAQEQAIKALAGEGE